MRKQALLLLGLALCALCDVLTQAPISLSRVKIYSAPNEPSFTAVVGFVSLPTTTTSTTTIPSSSLESLQLFCPTITHDTSNNNNDNNNSNNSAHHNSSRLPSHRPWLSWPPSPNELAHRVFCHAFDTAHPETTVCVPEHMVGAGVSHRANPLIALASLTSGGDVAMVLEWDRANVVTVVPADIPNISACEWRTTKPVQSKAPAPALNPRRSILQGVQESKQSKHLPATSAIKDAISLAVSCAELATNIQHGRGIYNELILQHASNHDSHLPSFLEEVSAEKGHTEFEVTSSGSKRLVEMNRGDLERVLRLGDAHDKCMLNSLCVWLDNPTQEQRVRLEKEEFVTVDFDEAQEGACVCSNIYNVDNFRERSVLDARAFFMAPPKNESNNEVAASLLELSSMVMLDESLLIASEACMAVDMVAEISATVQEQLQTTFVVMLVQLVAIPVICALLAPLIAQIFSMILPPIINGLMAIFEKYVKPPFEKAMRLKPPPLAGPVSKKNCGEVGELYSYFQHHREATMYSLMGLGDMLDLNPFVALGVWWLSSIISTTLIGGSQNRISKGMAQLLPNAVKNTVPGILIDLVVRLQGQEIARRIAHSTVHDVTHGVTHGLTHSLTRSVTVAVTHAMEQSRKHYYYCLYCYYTGAYCQYCTTYNEWAQEGNALTINNRGEAYSAAMDSYPKS